ncbi:MAG: Trehalose-6-phosphate phosphatase [Gammaproteobacteria bacterium]|nr:Trehalose-6-phosphate phosphatase [Gammaproteobacteria bacterium]
MPPFGADWAFFLDVDGTLLEIAEHPRAVRMPGGLVETLRAVAEDAGAPVALVSGRAILDLDRLFAPLRLPIAGQHGAERRDAAGELHHTQPRGGALGAIHEDIAAFVTRYPGLMLENKGAALCVHYRRAPALAGLVEGRMRRAAAALGDAYAIQPGKMVFELRPATADKGRAIAAFLEERPFRGRCPVFVGDDATDEHGFELVNGRGGHTVKVGAGPTCARWRLADAASVLRWLAAYVEYAGGGNGKS